ncbi:MAG: HAD-IA family hydrolase [Actinobacteria bacterium]|nr:HAD-IA family hydrolase [Actinomycetota bacterium]
MTRAVFLDALGTLLELEPPWVLLRSKLPDVSEERLQAAVRMEMDYYREHAHEGRDEASLVDLRERCARLISDELGVEISAEELVSSVRFDPYPDAEPALRDLRGRGLKLVVVSNWDCSLGTVLEASGLSRHLDGAVSSAETGSRKPDPGIFGSALALAGCAPEQALHVGDTPHEDVAGAEAAGVRALLIDREGEGDISALGQIVQHL